ncbi:MAG TPA: hypothetical protein PLV50_02070 [Smithella sp.]|nr:hypothetical protein [Smithella sp.]MDM7987792.1 hypothetical protein [Smithella sp.]HNY49657.1 hypothetical protein [Smithella sp.]HOG89296.1 hypothetical protein [Smithella sp.]HQG64844.1 hypothetical protein [Smithella sp.]
MRILRYIWALPNTLLGLLFVPLAFFANGGIHVVDGVLELHSSLISLILKKCMPVRGGVSAMTLGHVVLGQNRESLSINRLHERAHVKQYEILGPIFLPVYLVASLWAFIKGRGAYRGNYLERKAREHSHEI